MSTATKHPAIAATLSAIRGGLAETRYHLRATRRLLRDGSDTPGLDALTTALETLAASVEWLTEAVEREGQR